MKYSQANVMLKVLKKGLLIMLKLSMFFMLFLALAVGGVFYKISRQPLVLDDYNTSIRERVMDMMGGVPVDFDHAVFRWEKIHKPFYISVQNLRIAEGSFTALSATIPEAHIKIDPLKLIMGKLIPAKLEVFQPVLKLRYALLSGTSQLRNAQWSELLTPLFDFLEHPSSLFLVKNIQIKDATLVVEGMPESLAFLTRSVSNLSITRDDQHYHLTLRTHADSVLLKADARYAMHNRTWEFSLTHENVPFVWVEPVLNRVAPAKTRTYQMRSTGQIKGDWHSKGGFMNTQIQLQGSKGRIEDPAFFEKVLQVDDFILEATYHDGRGVLNALSFNIDGSTVKVSGEGVISDNRPAVDFSVKAEAQAVNLKHLHYLWPSKLAPVPRSWVVSNIKTGHVPHATMNLEGVIEDPVQDFALHISKMDGKIDIQDATVTYLNGMPQVSDVQGEAFYDQKNFHIVIQKAECHGQHIQKGDILITDMDKKDQNIVIDLVLKGSFKRALELIDHQPLGYARLMNMNIPNTLGAVQTHLMLDFPLERTVTLDQVKVTIKSQLQHVAFDAPLDVLPVRVRAGDLKILVNQNRLLLQGDAELNQSKSRLKWQRNFNATESLKDKLEITCDFDAKLWATLGLEKIGTIDGQTPLKLVYDHFSKKSMLWVQAPLKELGMRILGAEKQKGVDGRFDMEVHFKEGALSEIKKFECEGGENLSLKGSAVFSSGQTLPQKVVMTSLKLGRTSVAPTFKLKKNKTYRLSIQGGILDLESIIDQFSATSDDNTFKESFDAKVTLDKLYIMGQAPLKKVEFDMSMTQGVIKFLNMRSYFSKGKEPRTLFVMLHSPDTRKRVLEVSTNHFGELIESLGISDRLLHGRLAIEATHDNDPKKPWVGRFKIYNFNLKDPPVLGQLLSLAFPTGLIDLLSNEGMSFTSFSTRFKYRPGSIHLTDGRAKGASLGLTISGHILPKTRELKLQGTVMPAYFLNTLIGKIPLLGELITGGKDEGLFGVTYKITGSYDHPNIAVNPLSALTPGLIRKIFSDEEVEDSGETFNQTNE